MSEFSIQRIEGRKSSIDIDDRNGLISDLQVLKEEEKSSQPQLKYMMSQNSSINNEEVIDQEFDMNSIQQKMNIQIKSELQIQSNKQPNLSTCYFNSNEQKRQLRSRRKLNLKQSLINFQSENNSFSLNISNPFCKCTKSNCLKLYCQCFHQNSKCSDFCKCMECKNRIEYLGIRFNAIEKIKQKLYRQKNDDDLFDRSKIWGCKCQKSQCQKNYCECFVRNQKCSSNCRCKDCENKKRFPQKQKKKQKR
ncbi:unnamed protein product [Paramecium sonneborni]|uniref:CRC domain-containing protein n=1 Tax=Paramecium sonneborni TaxID=65129 RepID=A0A8S1QT88_9CILI|nr:unnamed protein product [Paramecium sonneborni]